MSKSVGSMFETCHEYYKPISLHMKYLIECVSNVAGYVTTEVVEILNCRLDTALEHFKDMYGDNFNVEIEPTYEDGKFRQVPAITSTFADGDLWTIYRMVLWTSVD